MRNWKREQGAGAKAAEGLWGTAGSSGGAGAQQAEPGQALLPMASVLCLFL